ncbi:glycoside hydrolase family 5 protein [Pseudomonas sp. S5(2021)]|uniref:glycoside hydrolase family 5 protein n=1 Tax=Stutzerimonas balearica TaxID=74829 RepID=UPI0007747061|nr:glycoside hydrolase family 5 protein [Stutzerimonas balearica]MBZ5755807.1 glycoside hydrolase family 5 protein [Pseudomonas sp. S5(2021)]OMG66045.1 endoglucanase [Stutzerimonas balearica]
MIPRTTLRQVTRLVLAAALAGSAPWAAARDEGGSAGIDLIGVNLSGAGFAPHVVPGKHGTNYFYPEKRHFKYYADKGIRLIRFPFIWERVQHNLGEDLDGEQLRLLKRTLDFAMQHGQKVILDMHNYGRYQGHLIGSSDVPYAAYAEVWQKLAKRFGGHPALLGYDIMNEPHGTVGLWPGAAQAAVDAIREVDQQALIFVEGERWSSAYHWPLVNANFLVKDPVERIVYEAHLYFDEDFSGKYLPGKSRNIDPMLGVERARPFVEWLQKHGQKGFLGEYGIPDDLPEASVAMDNLLAYLNDNCIPSAYWAGGPGWGQYRLAIEPRDGQDRPQMAILQKHLANDCAAFGPSPAPSAD